MSKVSFWHTNLQTCKHHTHRKTRFSTTKSPVRLFVANRYPVSRSNHVKKDTCVQVAKCLLVSLLPWTNNAPSYISTLKWRLSPHEQYACIKTIHVMTLLAPVNAHTSMHATNGQANTLELGVNHCIAQQGLGSWGFPHRENRWHLTNSHTNICRVQACAAALCSVQQHI